jgi:hypothetical protein
MNLNPIWHTVSFDIEGLTKSSDTPQITTIVPCDNDQDAIDYLLEHYPVSLKERGIINLEFKN